MKLTFHGGRRGRKIFDMNSGDTFNRFIWGYEYELFRFRDNPVFPKWLTAPVHYQEKHFPGDGTWAGVIRSTEPQFKSRYDGPGAALTLKSIGYKPHPKQKEFLESEDRHVFYGGG